jgi:hypothetical protein
VSKPFYCICATWNFIIPLLVVVSIQKVRLEDNLSIRVSSDQSLEEYGYSTNSSCFVFNTRDQARKSIISGRNFCTTFFIFRQTSEPGYFNRIYRVVEDSKRTIDNSEFHNRESHTLLSLNIKNLHTKGAEIYLLHEL